MEINIQFAVTIAFAIVGAALIVGGVVMFRGNERRGQRAFGASAITAGLMMWAVILFITPVSSTSSQGTSPNPVVIQQVLGTN
jgi:hypothetical protein